MPSSTVKTAHDERLWDKAKQRVRDEYGLTEADGDRYWRLVMGIYQRMKGTRRQRKGLLVALKSWPGEPLRHSEAAKLGWRRQQWRQSRRVAGGWKTVDVGLLSPVHADSLRTLLSSARQRQGTIDWGNFEARYGKSTESKVRTALRQLGLLHGKGRSAQLNILGVLAAANPRAVAEWAETGHPPDTFTTAIALISRALTHGDTSVSLEVLARDWQMSPRELERRLMD
ncbi:MAG: hypothetical protein J7M26_03470, partial [Armatimonadetes bacterium]|nr:hypothetical protein [Armatimonadota bacterium]